jgi:polyisoprenoid-binding protein YceI
MSILHQQVVDLPTGTWTLDPVHSSVGFSVKHMLVANFRGGFGTFDVTLDGDGLRGTVDVSTVDVSEPNLNGHLLAPDFFDVERYPQISFRSTAIRLDGETLDIDGELTIKGVTEPVTISGTLSGPVTGPDGSQRIGLELDTVVDRTTFGLDWNAPLPSGGFALGNEVKLRAELELVGAA